MVPFLREVRKKLCPAIALGRLFSVMLAQTVRTTHAAGVDFSKYHTYKWVELKGQHPDPAVDTQIEQAIDSQLAKKGLTKTNDATADLDVDYQTAITQTQEWQAYEDWTQTGLPGQNMTQHKYTTIDIGTLVIDMYDTAAKQLVWTGRAHKTLEPNSSREDRRENLDKAAKNCWKTFPQSSSWSIVDKSPYLGKLRRGQPQQICRGSRGIRHKSLDTDFYRS